MKLSKVLIYFGILVALAAYVYFVEIRYKKEQQTRKTEAERITKIDKDKIDEVDLTTKDGTKITIRKINNNWVLTQPVKVNADQKVVNTLLTSFSDSQMEKVLKKKDVSWKEYGLEKPEFTATAHTRDETVALYFGASNPSKTSYYLRKKGDHRLLLVADTLKNALNKSVFQLREKSVFTVAPVDVKRVVVVKDGKETELKREGPESWTMVKPESFKVKADEVNRGLIGLTNIQAKNIIDKPKKEGDPYGLDKPVYKIVLDSKNRKQTLLIGKDVGKKGPPSSRKERYARIEGQDTVYVIGSQELDSFKTDPKELRDRSLLSFKPKEIQKMEVSLDGKTWLLQKSAKGTWAMEKPEKKAVVETWPITGALWDLHNLEWKELKKPVPANLAEVGLDKPYLTVSLYKKDAKEPITLKIGWPKQEKEEQSEAKKSPASKPEPAAAPEKTKEQTTEPAEKGKEGTKQATETKPQTEKPAVTKPEAKESTATKPEEKKPAATKREAEKSAAKGAPEAKAAPKEANKPKIPSVVDAIVQPHGEENALFKVDSGFIGRVRNDLERMAGEKEKKK